MCKNLIKYDEFNSKITTQYHALFHSTFNVYSQRGFGNVPNN